MTIATVNAITNAITLGRQKRKFLSKAFSAGNAIAFQGKANISSVALFAKSFSFNMLSFTHKKQSNSLQVDFFSKLANNGKVTSNKCKKHFENNLCLYCRAEDHKLDSCPKKQTTVTSKDHSVLAATNFSTAISEKLLEK